MRDVLVTFVVFVLLPVAIVRPYVGVYLYSWLSYMNPHKLGWGFATEMPFTALAAAATLIGIVISRDIRLPRPSVIVVLWLLWVLWMTVSNWFAIYPDLAGEEWKRTMKIQLMIAATVLLIYNRQKLDGLIWIVFISVGFYGIKGGIFTILTGGQYIVWGPPGGFFAGNNSLALALLMVIPLGFYLYSQQTNKPVRMAIVGSIALSVLAVLASYSRGAFLGAVATFGVLALRSRFSILAIPATVVLLLGAFLFMPDDWRQRIDSIQNYKEDGSAMGRINAWHFAVNLANDRPLVGGGFQTFEPKLFYKYAPNPTDFHDAHSIYFEVLAEHGYVGLILFLLLGLSTYREGGKITRLCRDREELKWAENLSRMIQLSLVPYAVSGAFLGLAYFDLYYLLIAMTVILGNHVREQIRMPGENYP